MQRPLAVSKPEGTVVHPPLDQLVACPEYDLLTAALFPLFLLGCCFFPSLGLFLGRSWPKTAPLMHLYQHLEEWAVLDIFLLAILVTIIRMSGNTEIVYHSGVFCFVGLVLTAALVDFGFFTTINVAPAATSFAVVVTLTMLAALSYDPRLMWNRCVPCSALAAVDPHSR
jgi:uncharacterized paraquat-inducible protein A